MPVCVRSKLRLERRNALLCLRVHQSQYHHITLPLSTPEYRMTPNTCGS